MSRRVLVLVLSFLAFAQSSFAGVTANGVISYDPGNFVQHAFWDNSLTFDHPEVAQGVPNAAPGNDPFSGATTGALTPFNPPFQPSDVVRVSPGGNIALKLSAPVTVQPGKQIGVFVNNGLQDVTPDTNFRDVFPYDCISGGTGTAKTMASDANELLFSNPPKAIVSVKANAADPWTPLSASPISFGNPTNAFTDTLIDKLIAPPGTIAADYFKPFNGTLANFSGLTYPQMLTLLNGSAGGTWLDLSSTGLSQVQFVKFEVPADADYRFFLDAVTAVPEPGALGLVFFALLPLRRKGR